MRNLIPLLLCAASAANAASYSYSVYNPSAANFVQSDLTSWTTKHGTISCANNGVICPVYSSAATGGIHDLDRRCRVLF
jgi:hypothetical protein